MPYSRRQGRAARNRQLAGSTAKSRRCTRSLPLGQRRDPPRDPVDAVDRPRLAESLRLRSSREMGAGEYQRIEPLAILLQHQPAGARDIVDIDASPRSSPRPAPRDCSRRSASVQSAANCARIVDIAWRTVASVPAARSRRSVIAAAGLIAGPIPTMGVSSTSRTCPARSCWRCCRRCRSAADHSVRRSARAARRPAQRLLPRSSRHRANPPCRRHRSRCLRQRRTSRPARSARPRPVEQHDRQIWATWSNSARPVLVEGGVSFRAVEENTGCRQAGPRFLICGVRADRTHHPALGGAAQLSDRLDPLRAAAAPRRRGWAMSARSAAAMAR